jgi:Protein of unknown function (DUF4236)
VSGSLPRFGYQGIAMGIRFRRSFKVAPGVRLNVSKSGISTSIGSKGATVNIGRGKRRVTVGIPGTGVSYTKSTSTKSGGFGWIWILVLIFILLAVFKR